MNFSLSFPYYTLWPVPAPPDKGSARPAQGSYPSLAEGVKRDLKGEPKAGKEEGCGPLAAPAVHTGPGLAKDMATRLEGDHLGIWQVLGTLSAGWDGGLQAWPPNTALSPGAAEAFPGHGLSELSSCSFNLECFFHELEQLSPLALEGLLRLRSCSRPHVSCLKLEVQKHTLIQ